MDKFCTNCGHELKEGADYCLGCGKRLIKNYKVGKKQNYNSKEMLEIIGMILGVVSFFIIFNLDMNIGELIHLFEEEYFITKFFVSIFMSSIPFIPAFIGFIISVISLRKEKSIYGIMGVITSLATFTFISFTIIYLIK